MLTMLTLLTLLEMLRMEMKQSVRSQRWTNEYWSPIAQEPARATTKE